MATTDPRIARSYADATQVPFWLDRPGAPEPSGPLEGDGDAGLVIEIGRAHV